jgi:hypothetical protein
MNKLQLWVGWMVDSERNIVYPYGVQAHTVSRSTLHASYDQNRTASRRDSLPHAGNRSLRACTRGEGSIYILRRASTSTAGVGSWRIEASEKKSTGYGETTAGKITPDDVFWGMVDIYTTITLGLSNRSSPRRSSSTL